MQTIFNLPENLAEDLKRFEQKIEHFKSGSISAAEFRSFRVPQGVYEQREEGTYMLRVRLPAGCVLPHQMCALAEASREYGNGVLHVTTRQDIQVHGVALDAIHPALVGLYRAGLSTKGGGGNTVRNITACYDAGVCAKEAFDVTPYAIALTEFLLPDPLSYELPRKYKIGFSGCYQDCAGATVNDLGFIARTRCAQRGFAVYVGGGMGARSRVADLLEEFVPAGDIHLVAEAIKRVFDRHGDRKNKHRARLRFLIEQMGFERFRELYATQLSELLESDLSVLDLRDVPTPDREVPETSAPQAGGFVEWRERNVVSQKQNGYYLVQIPLLLGDISADVLEKLARVVEEHGEKMVRATQSQNLVIRWVHERELPELHRKLDDLNLAGRLVPILRNIVACAGASTCRLGICLSRGLARAIIARLNSDGLDLDKLGELTIHISGCPNSCGRHPVADIGLFGAARRIGGRLVPHYIVQFGGALEEGKTKLAQGKNAVPARNVPVFIADFLSAFQESAQFPDYGGFIEAHGREIARQLAAKYSRVSSFDEDKNFYFDWGADLIFSLAGRGPGECGAGVFDLIEVDLDSAREALAEGKLYAATVLAARALLVTQGYEARTDDEALALFNEHFIDAGLIEASFRPLVEHARAAAGTPDADETFVNYAESVFALVNAVRNLYDTMDPSLRFQSSAGETRAEPEKVGSTSVKTDREADFRGVVCPLNYVKTRLLLEQMTDGQVASILLDQEGARNVPESAEQDGHKVLAIKQQGNHWHVLIRKSQKQ